MHVFITGATGLIGTAVTAELLSTGHTVLALVRSDASAAAALAAGASVVRGSLGDLDVLRDSAEQSDGVINLAFSHDFSTAEAMTNAVAEEAAALKALGSALLGSDKPLVTVSGTPAVPGRVSTEADTSIVAGPLGGRGESVNAALALASRGVRVATVRLPRTVHNNGEGGFAAVLARFARQSGVSGYPGDGSQRWPAVHALDAAALFRLVLESAPAGSTWHAVDDEGDAVKDIAAVIGSRLGLPVRSVPAETFGPLGHVFAVDQPSSSATTRAKLGWQPTRPKLLADLEHLMP